MGRDRVRGRAAHMRVMAEKTDAVVGWLGRVERAAGAVARAAREVKEVRGAVVAWAWLWGPVGAVVWWVCTGEPVGWPLLDGLPWGR